MRKLFFWNGIRRRTSCATGAAGLEAEWTARLLDQRALVSPHQGVVVDRHYDPGNYAERDPVMTLATLDPVHIAVIAPAGVCGKMAFGDIDRGHVAEACRHMATGSSRGRRSVC